MNNKEKRNCNNGEIWFKGMFNSLFMKPEDLYENQTNWTLTQVTSNYSCFSHEYQLRNGVQVFVSVFLAILVFFSLLGNIVLCSIVYRKAAMRSGINLLLANMALSDFLNAVLNLPLSVVLFNIQHWLLGRELCSINVALCFVTNIEKMTVLVIISIDRYLIIVKRKDTMTPYRANVIIILSWFLALAISIIPILGWGKVKFRSGYIQCLVDFESGRSVESSYLIFITSVMVYVPALILFIVYSRILRTVHRSCFRVENHPPVTQTAMHMKGRLFIDYGYKRRTSTTILLLCLLVLACLFPISILNIYVSQNGFKEAVSRETYVVFMWISHLHGAINPIIYFRRIKKFRETVYELWPKLVTLAAIVCRRSKRRIRPHISYQVEKSDIKISCINLSGNF